MNISEIVFEKFCELNNIKFVKVDTQNIKTPDYILFINNRKIIVEVKQIDPNSEDLRTLQKIKSFEDLGESDLYSETPGERIRIKIKNAMPQLRQLSESKKNATMLVIYDNVKLWDELLDSYAIRVALHGIETGLISSEVAPEGGAKILKQWYGSRKKVSQNHNTTLSAISVLREEPDVGVLEIYHNYFAKTPIFVNDFKSPNVKQYVLESNPNYNFSDWKLIL